MSELVVYLLHRTVPNSVGISNEGLAKQSIEKATDQQIRLGLVAQACNSGYLESRGSQVGGLPGLQNKFKARLGDLMKSHLKVKRFFF